jgi:ribosomal protein L40E
MLVCQSCRQDLRREVCVRCGRLARVNAREADGPVCNRCYLRDPKRHEICRGCGEAHRVAYRDAEGQPWCAPCYPRTQRGCAGCGRVRSTTAYTDDGPVCDTCYKRDHQPRRRCGGCGKLRTIKLRATDTSPDLCTVCYLGPIDICAGCGQRRPRRHRRDGQPLCERCYQQPPRRCDFCGRQAPITALWSTGAVCKGCYPRIRSQPIRCPGCRQDRILTGVDEQGRAVCGQCAGNSPAYLCTHCGQSADGFVRGMCSRCSLHQRVEELLAGPDGQIPAHLQPIAWRLQEARNAKSALTWLERSSAVPILVDLAHHDGPLSHNLLDGYPRSRYTNMIRLALVHSGALPERVELLEQVDTWLDQFLTDKPSHHVRLVRPFAQWVVLRRARQRVRRQPFTEGSASWARQQIRAAADFLGWLDQHGIALADLDQHTMDQWLDHGGGQHYTVRYFLIWARRHRLVLQAVRVPRRQHKTPEQRIGDDEHWNHLRRCLHDTALPVRVRVAGALLLLYGQPISRIVRISTNHLTHRGDDTYLTINRRPLLLPQPIAALINDLSQTATPKSQIAGRGSPSPLLFPGQLPGQHLSVGYLVRELNQHGIRTRAARNTALLDLASELPAAILADLLGMHINTATRWVKKTRRDWTSYLAARAETRLSS